MSNIIGIPSIAEAHGLINAVDKLDGKISKTYEIAVPEPRRSLITAVYGASILLAGGDTPLSGMKSLKVINRGEILAWIGKTSSNAIYEGGIELEPGCEITFTFSGETPASLYARSSGFSTLLEVIEA